MIVAKELSKQFGEREHLVKAIDEIDLSIESAERVSIVGKSGSGKTTLLNLFAGLDTPSTGKLVLNGLELSKLSSNELAKFRLTSIGVIFQSFQLIPQRTALQNIELPLILAGVNRSERLELARSWLQRVGLEQREKHFPYQLSGGEQQRVAIARALVNQPPILLADEPTGNLDTKTTEQVVELLREVCDEEKVTFVLVTHTTTSWLQSFAESD